MCSTANFHSKLWHFWRLWPVPAQTSNWFRLIYLINYKIEQKNRCRSTQVRVIIIMFNLCCSFTLHTFFLCYESKVALQPVWLQKRLSWQCHWQMEFCSVSNITSIPCVQYIVSIGTRACTFLFVLHSKTEKKEKFSKEFNLKVKYFWIKIKMKRLDEERAKIFFEKLAK